MSPFGRRSKNTSPPAGAASAGASQRYGFGYLAPSDVYLDSACQTLRPQPVIDAMNEYFLTYNACGERVKYAWGIKVDDRVEATRAHVLKTLGLSSKQYTTCFTLNTTYALNLLLTQLPAGRYARILTTHTEHNSVFLPTMAFAQRCGVPRLVMSRSDDGALQYSPQDLANAVVVISAMNNVDGTPTVGLAELISETHKGGGIVIVDAAQAVPHALDMVRGLSADAVCFSAHKVYGASLGVVAAKNDLLASLTPGFIGGGMVGTVSEESFCLLDDLHSRLEPGLQAWGEIIALDTALTWLEGYSKGAGEDLHTRERRLSQSLYDGILEAGNATILGQRGSSLVTIVPTRVDGHQLAGFLSKAGIMVRSGYFCAHHWLKDVLQTGPAVRFSLGAHNTDDDIARTLEVTQRLLKGL